MEAIFSFLSSDNILLKVGLFFLVQALVYLILSKSSTIFSSSDLKRSHSFRPARSLSIRRFMAALADFPGGSELSPTVPRAPTTPISPATPSRRFTSSNKTT